MIEKLKELANQWNQKVVEWEIKAAEAAKDQAPCCESRCRARAMEIAICRRELLDLIEPRTAT